MPRLSPVLEHIVIDDATNQRAAFGYLNEFGPLPDEEDPDPNAPTVDEIVGPNNKFTPAPEGRGQPTSFLFGRQRNVFAVPILAGEKLVWKLRDSTATAQRADPTKLSIATENPARGNVSDTVDAIFLRTNNGNGFSVRVPYGAQHAFNVSVLPTDPENLDLLRNFIDLLQVFRPGQNLTPGVVFVPRNATVTWRLFNQTITLPPLP